MGTVIAYLRVFLLAIICLITIPVQALNLLLFKNSRFFYVVPFAFHNSLRMTFGIKLKIEGAIQKDKQTVFVGNHLSYLDIPVMGSLLKANFVSKDDVRGWPIFGLLAELSRTIFISRTPSKAAQSIQQMNDAINEGRSLIIFPEGTSTRGKEVLPFKSSFFDIFLKNQNKDDLSIQPFTIGLTKTNGQLVTKDQDYDTYAWHGDMDLQPHIWSLAKGNGAELTITFHEPISLKGYENRKILAVDCFDKTQKGLEDTQSHIEKEQQKAA